MADGDEVRWLRGDESPFGVPVVDLRPFALSMISTSQDPRMAENAMSYGADDGDAFIAEGLALAGSLAAALEFRVDAGGLAEGMLFIPEAMEDKWALYYRGGQLLCVRSWQRRVHVAADVRVEGDRAFIGPIRGSFTDGASPDLTLRQLEFALRAHALSQEVPAPLAAPPDDLQRLAMSMFSLWGRRALFATHHAMPPYPLSLLRTDSLLHVAIVRGDRAKASALFAAGAPFDGLGRDGLTLAQWALGSSDPEMLAWLLDRGCPPDVRAANGATALMNAVQGRSLPQVELLLSRGASASAADARGFTSLHRAAEMGSLDIAQALLSHGADRTAVAAGHTALSLARARNEQALIDLLA